MVAHAFHTAVVDNRLGEVKQWLQSGIDVDLPTNGRNYHTALQLAVKDAHVDVVRLLLDHHAIIDLQTPWDGWTALHHACHSQRIRIVEYLLDRKADVNKTDHEGRTPLMWAARGYFYSSAEKSIAVLELLVDRKADVTMQNKLGQTVFEQYRGDPGASMFDYIQKIGKLQCLS